MATRLIELPRDRVEEAAHVLARAFYDNPGVTAVLDRHSPEGRLRLFGRWSRSFVRSARRFGITTAVVDGERLVAAALVYPPGTYPLPIRTQLSIAGAVLASGLRAAYRFTRMAAHLQHVHTRTPHYYLFMIGVDPLEQGKGHGGRLLRHLNDLADERGVSCYLETDKEASVALYERFGYRVDAALTIGAVGNLRLWTMTRRPQSKSSAHG
jgi:ribosomal protein S18 acetylase RimI-like enzyme